MISVDWSEASSLKQVLFVCFYAWKKVEICHYVRTWSFFAGCFVVFCLPCSLVSQELRISFKHCSRVSKDHPFVKKFLHQSTSKVFESLFHFCSLRMICRIFGKLFSMVLHFPQKITVYIKLTTYLESAHKFDLTDMCLKVVFLLFFYQNFIVILLIVLVNYKFFKNNIDALGINLKGNEMFTLSRRFDSHRKSHF
jgi:hypothetical protein